jgi:hypothetical protein
MKLERSINLLTKIKSNWRKNRARVDAKKFIPQARIPRGRITPERGKAGILAKSP